MLQDVFTVCLVYQLKFCTYNKFAGFIDFNKVFDSVDYWLLFVNY